MRLTWIAAIGITATVLLCPAMLAGADRSQSVSPSEAPGPPAPAAAGPDPSVTVWVYNYAQVSKRDLPQGEKVTEGVFERAGITLRWVNCPVSGAEVRSHPICQERMRPQELALVVLPSFSGTHLDSGHMLGFSQIFKNGSSGHYAYVSYERVEAAARRGPAVAYQILGYVAAHELGHVLLASGAHSSSGIMRAKLEEGDFQDVAQGGLTFTPQQAQRLRDNVADRIRSALLGARVLTTPNSARRTSVPRARPGSSRRTSSE